MAPPTKKKATRLSNVVKPKRDTRRSTIAHKNHRFQTFSERISKLKIDPIRRRRNADDREELSTGDATYFGRSLEEWRDLNMSKTFVAFAKDASILCDSLAMVLHNDERIMNLLVQYIELGDALALEPLLGLLSNLARDLDVRFEKHFHRAVATITAVAASNEDPAVVEWCFNSLAWQFKYLSRVLVPDLRPLYDLMAPYLGKKRQKPFMIRFAAESLSFLVRKAAAAYERDTAPLDSIIGHMLKDCCSEDANLESLQTQGIMTLLTEAMKGTQGGLHSSADAILRSLIQSNDTAPSENMSIRTSMTSGILTSLIHYTNAETFAPICDIVVRHLESTTSPSSAGLQRFHTNMLFTIISVRKGSRIHDWTAVFSALQSFLAIDGSLASGEAARPSLLSALAAAFQYAPVNAVLPRLRMLHMLRSSAWAPHFLQFCDLFARLGSERFQSLLLPEFQKFFLEHWEQYGDALINYLPHLHIPQQSLRCPTGVQQRLVEYSNSAHQPSGNSSDISVYRLNAALRALPTLKLDSESMLSIHNAMLKLVKKALQTDDAPSQEIQEIGLGMCFATLLEHKVEHNDIVMLWPVLCERSADVTHLELFWSNMLRYVRQCPPRLEDLEGAHVDVFEQTLLRCLSVSSHVIRQAALDLLVQLYELRRLAVPELLSAAALTESTPISLETSRGISMNIRRLAQAYGDVNNDSLAQQIAPRYCFGLLHLQLSQAWGDAVKALADMSSSPVAEEIITTLSQQWLEGDSGRVFGQNDEVKAVLDAETASFQVVSDFECSNLAKVTAISQQVFESDDHGYPSPAAQFRIDHKQILLVADNAKQQALRVLNGMPSIAEKKSRMLVPVLLSWAAPSGSDSETNAETWSQGWSRKDQKAMLAVFAQFHNPKVLYKSAEVRAALLALCANGDIEIQQSALKALLAWKEPAIVRCQERLQNLLDEARFRDDIAVFFQDDDEDQSPLTEQDRATILPVLLRLVYGRVVAGGKEGAKTRRRAVFVALSSFGQDALSSFVQIALASARIPVPEAAVPFETALEKLRTRVRQQFGMLNMFDDMLGTLGSELEASVQNILDAVLLCTTSATRRLEEEGPDADIKDGSLVRSVRQVGMQCLAKIYSTMRIAGLSDRTTLVASELILPRLPNFAAENTQSISGTLRLLSAWSSTTETARFLTEELGTVVVKIAELLRHQSCKQDVQVFILREIIDNLLKDEVVLAEAQVTTLVQSIGEVIRHDPSKDVIDASVSALNHLASRIETKHEADAVVDVAASLLTKPSRMVSGSTKAGLLETLTLLLDGFDYAASSSIYIALCGLFSRMQGDQHRALLATVFAKLCASSVDLSDAAKICEDLSAMGSRLDEPDTERREAGFVKIYEQYESFSMEQWQPLVHICMFYIRDTEDIVNRSNAARVLERFVKAAGARQEELSSTVTTVLLPGIERGMSESSELVRAEFARLLGQVVEQLPDLESVHDMAVLTVDGDDEASFFANVLHIQQHRRLRALRRLAEEASKLSSNNVTTYLVPLLEHFVFDPLEGDAGRTLADQTVVTLGALATALKWPSFRAAFRRYAQMLKLKPDHEKMVLRLLGVLVDALSTMPASQRSSTSAGSTGKAEIIVRDMLPPLTDYLHLKDESTVDRRMPVAVTIVKLLQQLPEQEMASRLAPVLTDVCHVLRSRSPEARDQTRKALSAILGLVGPSYFGFILKELRGALQRGYQLHVLSYTVHALLVQSVDAMHPGDLDHCLGQITSVVMDDIFGVTGQEKEAEEYKTSMKEIKSSKSFDTMAILARITPVQKLGQLIQPIRALLSERLDSKAAAKIDSLLDRTRKGLDQNPASESREMLMFCHEIARSVHSRSNGPRNGKHSSTQKNRHIVQPEPGSKTKSSTTTTAHTFKLVSFALNMLRKVLRRHEELQTPANLAGFLPMTGDALVQSQEEVRVSAMRLLSTIMSVQLPELDANAPVYLKEAVRLIKTASSMTGDPSKAALELVTSILREKRSTTIKDKDIGDILKAIKADIDEPDRQGVIYKFLRAVLGRKIMITEVYEIMDEIAKLVVTNPDRSVREGARSAYIQFIMEYPQGKDRWNKQAGFFVENLKYEHSAGRQSAMELLNQMLSKVSDEVFAQLALTLFVALVPVQVSDVDLKCRQMAGILISKLFSRATMEQRDTFISLLSRWLKVRGNTTIQSAALHCWQILLRTSKPADKHITHLRDELDNVLEALQQNDGEVSFELVQDALQTFSVILEIAADIALAKPSASIWSKLQICLRDAPAAAKLVAAGLLESYFSDLASTSTKTSAGLASLPLVGSQGLTLDASHMRQMCYAGLRVLRIHTAASDEALLAQVVRNLTFLGRCFGANRIDWRTKDASDSEDEVDDDARDPSALAYLFNRLSYIVRQESMAIASRVAALDCQIALINQLATVPDIAAVIRPAYLLTDTTVRHQLSESQQRLAERASALLELLQKKIGTEMYLSVLGSVRKDAKARREERRQKRKIEAVSAPERWAKVKKQKHDSRKVALKARGLEARGKRRGW